MTKRIKRSALNLCVATILTAFLAGCKDKEDTAVEAVSTFSTVVAEAVVTPPVSTGSSEEPVIGTVTVVPGTRSAVTPQPVPNTQTSVPAVTTTVPTAPTNNNTQTEARTAEPHTGTFPQTIVTEPAAPTSTKSTSNPTPLVESQSTATITVPKDNIAATDPLLIINGGKLTANKQDGAPVLAAETVKATRFITTAPDTIEDPTFWSSPAYEYNLGNLIATVGVDSTSFAKSNVIITPIRGWLRYPLQSVSPITPNQYPLIVFLHGQHDPYVTNFHGYDYLAENLASHGYIVLSIDANAVNGELVTAPGYHGGDSSSESRAQLVLGTLDRLKQINEHGQVDKNGNPGALNILRGKIDFDHIGIMGHSRGGQGIANTIKFNKSRRGASYAGLVTALLFDPDRFSTEYPDLGDSFAAATTTTKASLDEPKFAAAINKYNIFYAEGGGVASPYDFKAAFLLAPTDFGGNTDLNNVPLGVLLPTCDGDMLNLQGAVSFDHNRYGGKGDKAPRYQITVHGSNHNFYNTIWAQDDFRLGKGPDHCLTNRYDSIRVAADDQRRDGLFLINSFMRYHVGGEEKFASWWKGMARLPDAACPFGRGPCDERVALTIQKNESQRKPIQYFTMANSDKVNLLGGAVTYSGFDKTATCEMPSGAMTAGICSRSRISDFEFEPWGGSGLRSIAEHAELSWTKAGATITNDLLGTSADSHDTLSFRLAVVRPMGQEVLVTLTDSAGKEATIEASEFSGAVYNAPRTKAEGRPLIDDPIDKPYSSGQTKMLLNMVAIPLKAFVGVDTTQLKELKLTFPKESGKVALADIQFQTFGRDKFGPRLVAAKK
ncbi:hypothetical protein [Phyllobacterium sp. YR531]|uniref:hypothetical protein n=1 Tax=Phyllobacterium sp. YR531 TaxID=1144343 RepID=UPI00026F7EB7|nr:hypothetical protein [Phyllobacterium sp. YR531]EJM99571.1 hypothetical protein PMI41_04030 [Phyllobacterium sp. YR531]